MNRAWALNESVVGCSLPEIVSLDVPNSASQASRYEGPDRWIYNLSWSPEMSRRKAQDRIGQSRAPA